MSSLRHENRELKSILTEKLGDAAAQVVYECTSELSREVMAGTKHIPEDDEEMGLEDPDSELPAGGGGGGGGADESGGGGGGGSGNPIRKLIKPDFRLMQSLQLVRHGIGGWWGGEGVE